MESRLPSDRPGLHPEPPPDLAARTLPIADLRSPWFRVHQASHASLYFGRSSDGRFNAPNGEYGVLYAGSDPHCAFIETFGQSTGVSIVTLSALAERGLSRIEAVRALRLVDLTGSGLARLGADERLCSGDHEVAQRWALAIWAHPARPDGLLYRARHDPSRQGVAIFDRAAPQLRSDWLGGWLDSPHRELLAQILDAYGFGVA
jgi:hypothetical protein